VAGSNNNRRNNNYNNNGTVNPYLQSTGGVSATQRSIEKYAT